MRKFVSIAVAIVLLALPSAALAQGYPSRSSAESFAVKDHVHSWCGKGLTWVCDYGNGVDPYAVCASLRGAHSRDCGVYYSELTPWLSYRACYQHSWVRLESNYTLTYHVDSDSCH